jgi:hypothetical protein
MVLDRGNGVAVLILDLVEKILDVGLLCVIKPATDEALHADHSVGGVLHGLVLCSITG